MQAIYQGHLFGRAEIVAGDEKKERGQGYKRRVVVATRTTWKTWEKLRIAARREGLSVSSFVEKLLTKTVK